MGTTGTRFPPRTWFERHPSSAATPRSFPVSARPLPTVVAHRKDLGPSRIVFVRSEYSPVCWLIAIAPGCAMVAATVLILYLSRSQRPCLMPVSF